MRTMFGMGFRREPWAPTLGVQFGDISPLVQSGVEAFKDFEKAEAERIAKEEAAKTQAAQTETTAAEVQAAQARAAAAEAGKIFGMPKEYVIAGGVGLVALAAIAAFAT